MPAVPPWEGSQVGAQSDSRQSTVHTAQHTRRRHSEPGRGRQAGWQDCCLCGCLSQASQARAGNRSM